ncbi:BgTH12-06468 [Blumeria graminis f. sp. triticale]|uniref:Translationally-controlled tumor protein homolog n=3 Tax=Blumeria graminis TaxID=34373 RepID=A0A061HCJ7_BLUGR|nr:hypothetical protein BGT96224_1021 [Blumeria graminis f. sp. tritici 96224]CAD6500761.1 BgTH12-06468 [Blumeria graminis f. sp. triticale]
MIIYKDVITGDELLSDSFNVKEINGIVYECDCAMIKLGSVTVDTGANASAEEPEDEVEDSSELVNNIVSSFRLQQTSFDKKSYLSHLKGYMKAVEAHLKAKNVEDSVITEFKSKAKDQATKIVQNFKDYDFYMGESGDIDGMAILMNYREDGTTPYITLWKHGLLEEKV